MRRIKHKKKWILARSLLAALLVVTVIPTYSWLFSQSDPVVNTFAGGTIKIKLDEAKVDKDGKKLTGEEAERVTANSYKYVAGAVLDKDPTVSVIKGSEECYVFVCVENQLTDKFTIDLDTEPWIKVAADGEKTVYAYKEKVDAREAEDDVNLPAVFTTVTVSEDLTAEDVEALGEKKLNVTAYAVQTGSLKSDAAIDMAVLNFLGEDITADHVEIK